MTPDAGPALVGALFPNREAAKAAVTDLRDAGLGDEELATAEWLDGRYVIASHAGRKMGHGVWIGAVVGAVVGGLLGALATGLFWPEASMVTALIAGGSFLGVTGAVLGAYFGLIRHRQQLWHEEDWAHLEVEQGQVLMVLDAGQKSDIVREIFDRHGGRRVEPVHPD
jgi:hypothetical protein